MTSSMPNPSYTMRNPLEPDIPLDHSAAGDLSASALTNVRPERWADVTREAPMQQIPASSHLDNAVRMAKKAALYNMALAAFSKEAFGGDPSRWVSQFGGSPVQPAPIAAPSTPAAIKPAGTQGFPQPKSYPEREPAGLQNPDMPSMSGGGSAM